MQQFNEFERQLFAIAMANIRRQARQDYWFGVAGIGLVAAVASVPAIVCGVWWCLTLP